MADRVLEKPVQQGESNRYRSFHAGASFGELSVEAQWVFRRSDSVNTKEAAHVSRTCTQGDLFCVSKADIYWILSSDHFWCSAGKMKELKLHVSELTAC